MGTSPSVAYVWAIVISLIFFLIATVVAYMIPNKPGGKDIKDRKVWFWVLLVLTICVSFGINYWIGSGIKIPTKYAAYLTASAISTGIGAVIYLVLGIVLSKMMPKSKLGSWF